MTKIVVLVRPGSLRPEITLRDGTIEVRVAAPARNGLANEAVRKALASALSRPPSAITLLRGRASSHKTFAVEGLSRSEASARLAAAVS